MLAASFMLVVLLFVSVGSRTVLAQSDRDRATSARGSDRDDRQERDPEPLVSLSAATIIDILRQEPGLLLEVKRQLVRRAYEQGRLLDPADITRIVGVLDWEMCTIGDSLTDLGTALAYWVDKTDPQEIQQNRWGPTTEQGSFTRQEIVLHYAQKTGCDVSHIAFYLAFARFKLAVIVQQIYFRYHQGLTKDARFAAMPATIQMLLRASLHAAHSGQI